MAALERVRVRMYQVGFGDCFLLSFEYAAPLEDGRAKRHVLIDFGSTHRPRTAPRDLTTRAAELIRTHSGGRLDAIVATHRHRDHLSGFGTSETAAIVDELGPALVVRPWPDDPGLAPDATRPRNDPRRFAASLEGGQAFASLVASRAAGASTRSLSGELAALAADQLPNREAIEQLETWGRDGRAEYLAAGQPTALEELVPGIAVRVLGPPTIDEWPEMTEQRANDPEYWLGMSAQVEATPQTALDDVASAERTVDDDRGRQERIPPGPVSWLIDRLERQQLNSLLRIVRTVDDALNNTSLILLIDAGDRRMLFPGDAQIENWSWALKNAPNSEELRAELAETDLYKVGHHGSRNATPRSLFRLWGEAPDGRQPITALMSTLRNVHGRSEATAVPRRTLVQALKRRATLWTTDRLPDAQPFVELSAPTAGGHPFERVDDGG